MAVVERRADAVEGAEVGAQDGEAREGHDQPDEGDESDDADGPGVGRKVPRHTAHEEYKADRYLEYPREPVELAPAEAHHGAHVVPANCQCRGALPPAQAAPEPGPVPGPTLLRAPAADLAPSGDQEHGVPALEPSLATVPREDLNLLECTSVEVGGSSGEVKLSYEMGDLRHDHPLLRRLASPYTYYLRGLLPARPSKFIVGNIPVLDSAGLCDWFNGEFECARVFFFCSLSFVLSAGLNGFGLYCIVTVLRCVVHTLSSADQGPS